MHYFGTIIEMINSIFIQTDNGQVSCSINGLYFVSIVNEACYDNRLETINIELQTLDM